MDTGNIVRRTTPADIPAMMPVIAQYWAFEQIEHFDPAHTESLLRELLTDSPFGAAWVAERGGRLAGYLVSTFTFSIEYGGKTADIDEFFVIPAARRHGCGSALFKAAEEYLAANGFCHWQLQIAHDNEQARAFYARRGFAPRDRYDLMDRGFS
jgi:GNAT superfamily N-acetyltransferase